MERYLPMNQCKYLMVLNSKFCRLKGQENPKCRQCSIKDTVAAQRSSELAPRGLRRLQLK